MLDFFGDIGGAIMAPLYYVISAVLVGFHKLFGGLFGESSGFAWVFSIIGLTLVIRMALIPLFVKQIKSSRNMQLIQPKVRELQKKYGHDREKLAQETMKLYKDSGTNPFASCLPILLQMPIFLALFRLIDQAAKDPSHERGLMTEELNTQFGDAIFLGAKISDTFLNTDDMGVRVLAAILVLAMTATTFLTQRQLMSKNNWTTSNLWTMGQQLYVIRNNPAPGTPAAAAKEERDRAKAERKGLKTPAQLEEERLAAEAEARREEKAQTRQQPQRQTKAQRNKKKR